MIQTAARLDLVQEYYFSQKLKEIAALNIGGKNIINLGIGSPDLPPHENIVKALIDSALSKKNHAYQSYIGVPALREAIAEWYQRFFGVSLNPANEVLPLLGSKEGIMHVCMSYLQAGDIALVPNPGYPTYRAAALLSGAEVIDYELDASNNWLIDFDALEQKDLSKVKLMFVNYPNMPTGAKADSAFFERLVAFAQKYNILILNDNPYNFILNKNYLSLLSIKGADGYVLELNSLSKSHNMAGWRVGMICGHKDLISNVLKFKSNMDSGMFLPVQHAAIEALRLGEGWYDSVNIIYRERQAKVFELLELLDCQYDTQQTGMFVWAKIPDFYKDAYELSDKILYDCNVFITPGGIFGSQGNGYVRVSLCAEVAVFENAIFRIDMQFGSMNVYALEGYKVKFGNTNSNFKQVSHLLEVGKIYTVEKTDISRSSTSVKLKGIPNEFNSVYFKDADYQSKEKNKLHPQWAKWNDPNYIYEEN
jgi:LL-diaminopimelate aminotransferase